jgi:hypothetical protein
MRERRHLVVALLCFGENSRSEESVRPDQCNLHLGQVLQKGVDLGGDLWSVLLEREVSWREELVFDVL